MTDFPEDQDVPEPEDFTGPLSSRPILFIDIDGVLNPFGGECPVGFQDHGLFPDDEEPVRVCQHHAAWLAELAEVFDLVWATGWSAADRDILAGVLAMPEFHGAADMPPVPFEPSGKVQGVAAMAGDRACAWIDDLVTPEARAWAARRETPTLLIETQPHLGMTREHVDQLISWARTIPGEKER